MSMPWNRYGSHHLLSQTVLAIQDTSVRYGNCKHKWWFRQALLQPGHHKNHWPIGKKKSFFEDKYHDFHNDFHLKVIFGMARLLLLAIQLGALQRSFNDRRSDLMASRIPPDPGSTLKCAVDWNAPRNQLQQKSLTLWIFFHNFSYFSYWCIYYWWFGSSKTVRNWHNVIVKHQTKKHLLSRIFHANCTKAPSSSRRCLTWDWQSSGCNQGIIKKTPKNKQTYKTHVRHKL